MARRPAVAQVVGPAQQPIEQNLGAVYARNGDAVRLLVIFDRDPLGASAITELMRLRDDLPQLLRASGLEDAQTSLAGDSALAAETVSDARGDIGRVAPTVLLVVFVILAVFLRSLVAPLYLVAASVLALAAALGATVYVFDDLLGYDEITYFVPFAAAVLLVPLGSDYNVFLAGRIWREARERPLREAVAVAGARAQTAITVAGIVLALSFAALALVPLRSFRELAFAMSAGLLIDAFVVRTLLIPAHQPGRGAQRLAGTPAAQGQGDACRGAGPAGPAGAAGSAGPAGVARRRRTDGEAKRPAHVARGAANHRYRSDRAPRRRPQARSTRAPRRSSSRRCLHRVGDGARTALRGAGRRPPWCKRLPSAGSNSWSRDIGVWPAANCGPSRVRTGPPPPDRRSAPPRFSPPPESPSGALRLVEDRGDLVERRLLGEDAHRCCGTQAEHLLLAIVRPLTDYRCSVQPWS
ncbi:MAG: MMPL family transporter, partial [Solirubrobacteraceae bacterium]